MTPQVYAREGAVRGTGQHEDLSTSRCERVCSGGGARKSAPSFWRHGFRLYRRNYQVMGPDRRLALGSRALRHCSSSSPLCRGEERLRVSRAGYSSTTRSRRDARGRVSFPLRGARWGRGRRLGRAGVCESARSALSPETDGIGDGVRYPLSNDDFRKLLTTSRAPAGGRTDGFKGARRGDDFQKPNKPRPKSNEASPPRRRPRSDVPR